MIASRNELRKLTTHISTSSRGELRLTFYALWNLTLLPSSREFGIYAILAAGILAIGNRDLTKKTRKISPVELDKKIQMA